MSEVLFQQNLLFAQVILPISLDGKFTYSIPQNLVEKCKIGKRAVVPFGKNKIHTGIITSISETTDLDYDKIKPLLDIPDNRPILLDKNLTFYQWLANYYLCTEGEIIKAALPAGFRIDSTTYLQLNPYFNGETEDLTEIEIDVLVFLQHKDVLSLEEVEKQFSKSVIKHVSSLAQKDIVLFIQDMKERFVPKKVSKVRFSDTYNSIKSLEEVINGLDKKQKQQEVLLYLLQNLNLFNGFEQNKLGLEKSNLLDKGFSVSSINTLAKNGILEIFESLEVRNPLSKYSSEKINPAPLSVKQNIAFSEIKNNIQQGKKTILLKGVTGSGKSELYFQLIKETIEQGKQVLYLLPEIALSGQIVDRLRKIFGNTFSVYHSKYSDNERVEVWKHLSNQELKFVVGTRSSIFLPFENLGLIVVDEEHDSSYKQFEPNPRYSARDAAVYLAHTHDAVCLLGTATPSIESYQNAITGKWGYIQLNERFSGLELPEILLRGSRFKHTEEPFSEMMPTSIQTALDNKEQVIVFQNRRGFSPFIECHTCGHIPYCPQCNVSLTYHFYKDYLKCHYCGHTEKLKTECTECSSKDLKTVGSGTEKIEEELKILFPNVNIDRMDYDTTRNKFGHEHIINRFSRKETSILVGTQMVTKGLDFDNVSLVVVKDIDRQLHYPDFRSYEYMFQLLTQVSGRAGRKNKKGKVIIETNHPEHPLFSFLKNNNLDGLYQEILQDREEYKYPPFLRLVKIIIKDKDKYKSARSAEKLKNILLTNLFSSEIIGPQEGLINRIKNLYLNEIFIKIPHTNLSRNKSIIKRSVQALKLDKLNNPTQVIIDVDPR